MVDEATKQSLAQIPLLKTKAGPREGDLWVQRLKEEYTALIKVHFVALLHYLIMLFNGNMLPVDQLIRSGKTAVMLL